MEPSSMERRISVSTFRENRRLLWRGKVVTSPEVRGKFMEATEGKKWADVKALDWDSKEDIEASLLPMEDHCKYVFLAHTERRSFPVEEIPSELSVSARCT
jgi:hypothetical protein